MTEHQKAAHRHDDATSAAEPSRLEFVIVNDAKTRN